MTRFVDLTRPLHPDMPRFPTDPPLEVTELADAATDGFEVCSYRVVGPSGTHVDAPAHVVPGGRTLADIPLHEMVLPLVVFSLLDAPFLTATHILTWEDLHGPVPAGCFATLHTGELDAGWALDAVQLLHARGVVAIGHDTLNTDPAELTGRGEYPAQRWWLSTTAGRWNCSPDWNGCPRQGHRCGCPGRYRPVGHRSRAGRWR